jgi:beta-lactamase class A
MRPVSASLAERLEMIGASAGGEVAVALRHLERGERYDRLAEQPFVAASTIKLPILVALHDAAARGALHLDERVRLRPEDQVTGSGVLQLLSPGLELPLRDLAELMIAVSDNAATNMILERVGIAAVNACIAALGLRQTRVHRGLQVVPAGVSEFNTVTAADLTELLVLIAQGRAVSWEACRRMVGTLKRQQINDALPALLPDAEGAGSGALGALPRWELAHKTGGILGYQHDVGLLYLPGQTIALSVLTHGCGGARAARARIAEVGLAVWEAYGPVA